MSKVLKALIYLITFASLAAAAILIFTFNDSECQFAMEGSSDWSKCSWTSVRVKCEYPAMSVTGKLPTLDSPVNISLTCGWDNITIYLGYASCAVSAFFLLIAEISFSKKPSLILTIFKTFVAVLAGLSLAVLTGFMTVNMIEGRKNKFLYYNQELVNKEVHQYFYILNTLAVVFPMLVICKITSSLWKKYRGETPIRSGSVKNADASLEVEEHQPGQQKDAYRTMLL